MQEAQRSQKYWHDQHAIQWEFQPGQKVLLLLSSSSHKLLAKWQGPYTITEKMVTVTYEVYHPEKEKGKQTYYVNLLKARKERPDQVPLKVLLARTVNVEEKELDTRPETFRESSDPVLAHL